ncbi:hypothetical protein [Terriglobus tenax]|uniref:hypothetical protein n=1 Tax=Terriglobus tenax TaxID=1111115 RepID=UPI0021E08D95|nr:hypothetical protein [Terriglobus tenax]
MLVEIALMCIVSYPNRNCEEGEHIVLLENASALQSRITVKTREHGIVENNRSLEFSIAHDFASLKDVRHVLMEMAEGNMLIWIAVDNPTREIREQVFQKQFGIIDAFPEYSFDFNLLGAKGRNASEIATNAKVVYSRKDS